MSDLTAGSVVSCYNFTINDDSTTDTGAQCYHNNILTSFCTTLPHLTECCNVCIVSYFDRQTCKTSKFFCHVNNSPAKIDTIQNNSVISYRSRNSDTDAFDFSLADTFLCQLIVNGLCNVRKYSLSIVICIGCNLPFVEKLAACLKKSHLYRSSTYIYSKTIFLQLLFLLDFVFICLYFSIGMRFIQPIFFKKRSK